MNDTERRLKELFRGIATDARKIAQNVIAAEVGTLIRGGKVLWSALPYPKAGTTNTGPTAGHVGAVQPDGVTITIDPETGIISGGGGIVPGPLKGAILRGNIVGGDLIWEVYEIDAGHQGDLLMNDHDNSGLPIWIPAASVIGPYLPTNDSTVGAGIALDVGPSGTLPTNWFRPTFVPAGWGPTIAASPTIVQSTGTPGAWISYTTADVSATDVWGMRANFSVPPGAASCTLSIKADNYLDAVYINGTNMGFSGAWWNTTLTNPPIAVNVPIANLILGGTNLIALQLRNGDNIPPGPNPTGVIYSLSFT